MLIPANVQDWSGSGPSGPFILHGGDLVPAELETIVPDAWKSPAVTASAKSAPVASPASASGGPSP